MFKIALLGYGTIGSGVYEVLDTNREVIAKRVGEEIEVKYILDLREFPGTPVEKKIVHDFNTIKDDPEVKLVVEMMGGVEPAFTFASEALKAGKNFATSNKALIAAKGPELFQIAKENNVSVLMEASVGGGIPIIRPLNVCLTGDVVEEIAGILNGTTNYMLTKMTDEGCDFDEILKDAQAKGYAEKDPTADIEGHDPCRKIAILTSIASGKLVDYTDIHTEGITKITPADINYAKAMGRSIKLVATSRKTEEGYSALVSPLLLDRDHPLYNANGVFNAVFVHGNMIDDCMFYGRGAGSLPTASAVVSDIVDIAKNPVGTIYEGWSDEKIVLDDYRVMEYGYFVRTDASKEAVEAAFGAVEYVSMDGVAENAFVTGKMSGFEYEKAAAALGDIKQMIRMV